MKKKIASAKTPMKLPDLTEDQARAMLEKLRWPDGPKCPTCLQDEVVTVAGGRAGLYRCKLCKNRRQFTVTVGTIFEDSHVPLRKWVMAFHLMCSSKKGISALQLKRVLGVAYQTAWFMAHRIRWAMTQEPLAGMLKGTIEVDETYVGGKPRFHQPYTPRHEPHSKGLKFKAGRGTEKAPVMALIQRDGKVVTRHLPRVGAGALKGAIRELVHKQSKIYTDQFASYRAIGNEFYGGHETVNHSEKEYARGDVHVNTCESYFALLKRGIHGAFHHVSKTHLHRYCSEFDFRWNHRKISDQERTLAALQGAEGKRLTYKPLTEGAGSSSGP